MCPHPLRLLSQVLRVRDMQLERLRSIQEGTVQGNPLALINSSIEVGHLSARHLTARDGHQRTLHRAWTARSANKRTRATLGDVVLRRSSRP